MLFLRIILCQIQILKNSSDICLFQKTILVASKCWYPLTKIPQKNEEGLDGTYRLFVYVTKCVITWPKSRFMIYLNLLMKSLVVFCIKSGKKLWGSWRNLQNICLYHKMCYNMARTPVHDLLKFINEKLWSFWH